MTSSVLEKLELILNEPDDVILWERLKFWARWGGPEKLAELVRAIMEENKDLRARTEQLISYLDVTADGVILDECDDNLNMTATDTYESHVFIGSRVGYNGREFCEQELRFAIADKQNRVSVITPESTIMFENEDAEASHVQ